MNKKLTKQEQLNEAARVACIFLNEVVDEIEDAKYRTLARRVAKLLESRLKGIGAA
jgi:hypothetical protein